MRHYEILERLPQSFPIVVKGTNCRGIELPLLSPEHIDFFYEYHKPYKYYTRHLVKVIDDGEHRISICTGTRAGYYGGSGKWRHRRLMGGMIMCLLTKKGEEDLQSLIVEALL